MADDKQGDTEPEDLFLADEDAVYADGPMRVAHGSLEAIDGSDDPSRHVLALVLEVEGDEMQPAQQVIRILTPEDARRLARSLEAEAVALSADLVAADIDAALHEAELLDESVTVRADTSFITSSHEAAQVETDE